MDSLDFKRFLSSIEPFSYLDEDTLLRCVKGIDIEYYKKDETILQKGVAPTYYFVVAKGFVAELDEEPIYYGVKDSFCFESIIKNSAKSSFVAGEECILYAMKKELFLELFYGNDTFKNYYFSSISGKFSRLLQKESDSDLASFISARVKDSYFHKVALVDAKSPIIEGVKKMSSESSDSLIIKFEEGGHGIVTNTDLREKVLLVSKNINDAIGDIAVKNLITIDEEDFLFNALLLMIEHSISRVGVKRGEELVGVLEQIDLLSAISNRAHIIALEIEKAKSIEELKDPSSDVITIIKSLQKKGVKVRHITKLLAEINSKIYKKLYELIMPRAVVENSALIVLGSEGRREQTLRVDQDNAVILRDGFVYEGFSEACELFSDTLISFGFPPCHGNIMVKNPYYSKELREYKKDIDRYVDEPLGEHLMNMAILFDSFFICGERTLFEEFKVYIRDSIRSDVGYFAHFARATLIFETPLTLFAGFVLDKKHQNGLDIKKGAIFPIVHGIRSLALEKGIDETNTLDRIKALNNDGYFDREFASELIEAFTFLLTLRLKLQLQKIEQKKAPDNFLNPMELSKFERDLLRDVLKLVDKLKKQITYHFKLNMVS